MARTAEPGRALAILAAARSVIKEQGYEATRMSEIAVRAGIASGTIYRYFESKEAIVMALADQYHEEFRIKIQPFLKQRADRQTVSEAVTMSLRFSVKEFDLFQLSNLATGLSNFYSPASDKLHQELSQWIEKQMQLGMIMKTDPMILTELITAAVDRAAERSVIEGKKRAKDYELALVAFVQRLLE